MADKLRRDLEEDAPMIPRLGDEFRLHQNGVERYLQVVATEWDEQDQEATIKLKPAIGVHGAEKFEYVVVQDSNPYKVNRETVLDREGRV